MEMINIVDIKLKGLEERSHKGEKVRAHQMDEFNVKLDILEILLQKQMQEYHKCGWIFVKKVKWPIMELYERKCRNWLSAWLNMEEKNISKVEYGHRFIAEVTEVHICEPEQGRILGEDDESDEKQERPNEYLIEWLNSVELKHKQMMLEASKETKESHDFEIDNLCLNASYAGQEDEKSTKYVINEEEGTKMAQQGIKVDEINKILEVRRYRGQPTKVPIDRPNKNWDKTKGYQRLSSQGDCKIC